MLENRDPMEDTLWYQVEELKKHWEQIVMKPLLGLVTGVLRYINQLLSRLTVE